VKGANQILGLAIEDLKNDWAKIKGVPAASIKWQKTNITLTEFTLLMDPSWEKRELEALFYLYDFNHDNTITWKEYICVCALIMAGSVKDKMRLIFNCFDEDGNGTLSRDEFLSAAKRFSSRQDSLDPFVDKVFRACDADGDNKVTLEEFMNWQESCTKDFDEFVGTINILKRD